MLGRPPRGEIVVSVRCHHGLPAVTEVAPVLPGGDPFPTLFWLTCPLAVKRVGRLEGDGLIRALESRVDVAAADRSYAALRRRRFDQLVAAGVVPSDSRAPRGGVSGAHGGVKCLHGRLAYWLAGGEDRAGEETAAAVAPLDCAAPCVAPDREGPDISASPWQPTAARRRIGRGEVFGVVG